MEGNEEDRAPNTAHPPIFSKQRKTATRPKKPAKSNAVGAAHLEGLFARPQWGEQATSASAANPQSTSYAMKDHGERMDLDAPSVDMAPLNTPTGHSSTDVQQSDTRPDSSSATTAQPDMLSESLPTSAEKPFEYSNEARVYHARYDYLSKAHDIGRYSACREGCFDILTEPRLPNWTRIQILQVLSTLLQPAGAEDCLLKVETLLDKMDDDKWQSRALRSDNRKMMADITVWRQKRGFVGQSLDGKEWGSPDAEPVPELLQA